MTMPLAVMGLPWLLVVAAWLADVSGRGLPKSANVGLVWLALALTLGGCGWAAYRLVRGEGEGGKAAGRTLLALLVLSLAVRFVGLDFELLDHPRNDEGVYYQRSLDVNAGDLLPKELNYGHLPYYAGALALWVHELIPTVTNGLAAFVYGLERESETGRILLRGLGALCGALTTLPVFWIGYRIAGLSAAALAGFLVLFSSLYNEVAHTWLSDVPAGFFAALSLMFVARLVEREKLRDYLLAGVAAGLAAGSKYPGGMVAVGIIGVWAYWRWRRKSWSWSLVWAGLASIAALCAVMPVIWLSFDSLFRGEGLDIMFGFRQYARGGWAGVVKDSNTAWYGARLAENFGIAALVGGVAGAVWLARSARKRLFVLLVFPATYLALLISMRMVVSRNLQPVLPALAALLGAGLAGWIVLAARLGPRQRRMAVTAMVVATLAIPAWRTLAWDFSRTRPGTRQLAKAWLAENVPEGAGIISEDYTPRLSAQRFRVLNRRFAARVPLVDMRKVEWDYLLLSRNAHARFLNPDLRWKPSHENNARLYEEMFAFDLAEELRPGSLRAGSHIAIYRLEPQDAPMRTERFFKATDATWLSDPKLRRGGALVYTRKWQYGLFKDYFEAGSYQVTLLTEPEDVEGWVYVVSRENVEIGTFDAVAARSVEVPQSGKYFFKVFLTPPSRLAGLRVEPADPDQSR